MKLVNYKIKAILFDSGKVLNRPSSGHWFISPNFFKYVDEEKFNSIEKKRIYYAFKKANEYINEQNIILDKASEYKHFIEFYKIFSVNLPELNIGYKKAEMLAKDLVYNTEKYVFYDDAKKVLPKLREKYKLGIVSDAWPSLWGVYVKAEMDIYFDCVVISSFLGVIKPNAKMYQTALEQLKVSPQEVIFIDDNLENCIGAMKLGINSILLCRNKWEYYWNKFKGFGKKYFVINSLEEINKILE